MSSPELNNKKQHRLPSISTTAVSYNTDEPVDDESAAERTDREKYKTGSWSWFPLSAALACCLMLQKILCPWGVVVFDGVYSGYITLSDALQ